MPDVRKYVDLEYQLRSEPKFANRVMRAVADFQLLERKARKDREFVKEAQAKCREIMRLCNYNPVLFSGYYFPSMFSGKPLSFSKYPMGFTVGQMIPEMDLTIMGSRQISKSVSLAFRQIINGHFRVGYHSMYVAPHSEHVKTYGRNLEQMYQAFRYKMKTSKYGETSNLNYKRFLSGGTITLLHILEDATKARGKTMDELLIDEYQNFDIDFLDELLEVLSSTQWRVFIKGGTSLTTDTALNKSFESSSKGYWHILCPHCGHENQPLVEEGVMDMLQPSGLCCSKCTKPVDPMATGMFVHREPHLLSQEAPRIGIHVPQFITPAVLENPARWRALVRKKETTTLNKFMQENLGLPTEQGAKEISENDLIAMCKENDGSLREPSSFYQKEARGGRRYVYVISGCDWGGSDHNRSAGLKVSTTVHVVMGVLPDNTMEIIYFQRYEDMDYAGIIDDIQGNHHKLMGRFAGTDFGVGYYYNTQLRNQIDPTKHLIFQYAGPRSRVIKPAPDSTLINHFMLNKTESVSALYDAVKERRIKCYSWEHSQPFLNDFLNMYRNVKESDTGVTSFTYRSSPSKPNDALMAVNYAYVVARLLLGEPLIEDPAVRDVLNANLHGNGTGMQKGYGGYTEDVDDGVYSG
jgi:hypothetical protein